MKRTTLLALAALIGVVAVARAGYQKVPVVRLRAEAEVAAPPGAVWAYLTRGKNLVTWCPVWKSPRNAALTLTKVGDVLDYTDEWGHGGRSIVTYFAKDKELRVSHEPNKGDYICQAKITLEPGAKGTVVRYVEQYTDESAANDLEATAEKMKGEMDGMMAALKRSLEKK